MSLAPSPTSPLLALRAAILAYLATDAPLGRLMGGSLRLADEPPRRVAPVNARFGDAEIRDDSVDGARRHRHALALTVFARPGSLRSAVDAAERIATSCSTRRSPSRATPSCASIWRPSRCGAIPPAARPAPP